MLHDLITSSFPEFKINGLQVITEGWDNLAVKANGDNIFRFPGVQEGKERLRREIRLLWKFNDFPVRVPKYLNISKGSHFFAGYGPIPGVSLGTASDLKPHLLNDMVRDLHKPRTFNAECLKDVGLPVYTCENWIDRQRKVVGNFEAGLSPYI